MLPQANRASTESNARFERAPRNLCQFIGMFRLWQGGTYALTANHVPSERTVFPMAQPANVHIPGGHGL